MKKQILILAGYNNSQKNKLIKEKYGVNRHMFPIFGTPIIHRTQQQLIKNGYDDYIIFCSEEDKDDYLIDGVWQQSPQIDKNEILPTLIFKAYKEKLLFEDKMTIILFGDTVYSDEFMNSILNEDGKHWKMYGAYNYNKSKFRKQWAEIYGYVFNAIDYKMLCQKCEELTDYATINKVGNRLKIENSTICLNQILYVLYNMMAFDKKLSYQEDGPRDNIFAPHKDHFVDILDYTDDIDNPNDIKNLEQNIKLLS